MTGPALEVANASLRLGAFALKNFWLTLGADEILVLLGPNGAGKSVSLETIAGFHRPATGRIAISGRDVTRLPPERRRIGFVVQNFGLFPHLSVAENVAFGAGAPGPATALPDLLERFGIAHLRDRSPRDLSPGEQQRVGLARALATRPELFLLDEPFAALDAQSRERLREELRGFLRAAGLPAIFVSHDRNDVFALADSVAVMFDGAIAQRGTPADIFHRPASLRLAEFVGVENLLPGEIVGQSAGQLLVRTGAVTLQAAGAGMPLAPGPQPVTLCLRAEAVEIVAETASGARSVGGVNALPGRLVAAAALGPLVRLTADCGVPLVAYVTARTAAQRRLVPGAAILAEIDAGAIHLLPETAPPRRG